MSNEKSNVIKLVDVRLSFPKIWKAVSFEEGQIPKYEATFLLDPSIEAHANMIKEIKTEAARVATEKWGQKWKKENFFKGKCYGTESDLTEVYDGYADMFWVRTSKNSDDGRVMIVDSDKTPLTAEDGKPYGGCYVVGTLTLWCQDNKFGKRINANLRGIMFRSDGPSFSSGVVIDADNEFGDMEPLNTENAADSGNDFLD